jgi:ABC-type amino acid transport system permease subunit
MNLNDNEQLKLAISRELKSLPELTAPASLASRVMAALERRANLPWHHRSWATWQPALQMASLAAMLALFGGLCFAGWELSRTETIMSAMHRAGQLFSGLNSIGSLFNILAGTAVLVAKKLGSTFIIACLVAAGLGYAVFMGLGTFYFRLAFAKR